MTDEQLYPADAETNALTRELFIAAVNLVDCAAKCAGQSPRIAEVIAQEQAVTVEVDVVPHPAFRVIANGEKIYHVSLDAVPRFDA